MPKRIASWILLPFVLMGCDATNVIQSGSIDSAIQNFSRSPGGDSANSDTPRVGSVKPPFTPPYPDRVNPFRFVMDQQEAKQPTEVPKNVRVIGFASVQSDATPKAILQINGVTYTAIAGDVVRGITVESIHDPKVDLQLGKFKWSIGLFD